MNEDQYFTLCRACDHLLLAPGSGIERIATPWLHVIRAHPIFLDSYSEIFGLEVSTRGKRGVRRLRSIASALRTLIKACIAGAQPWTSVGELPSKCDVLMVSHLVNKSFSEQEGDFYYGKVAGELAAQGISAVIALVNHTDAASAALAANWRRATIPRVILAPVLDFTSEWLLYHRARAAAQHLKSTLTSLSNDLDRRVVSRAVVEAASGGAVSALRLAEQIKMLVLQLQPKAIVVTHEGHSWERVAFASARSVLPQIRCIGYMHAGLFKHQHAVQRPLTRIYNADVILTPGRASQARMQKNPKLQGVQIETLGSNRSLERQFACASKNRNGDKRACLVLPEGTVSECNLLFGFALECARIMPDINFIWRFHPNMNYEALTRQNSAFSALPSNVILSKLNLAEDIARSHFALYRGSTAIVQAAVSGVSAVYLHQPGEIPIDTLYEIADLHAWVATPDDFRAVAEEEEGADVRAKAQKVQDYCEQMFTPINSSVLAACIKGELTPPR